MGLHFFALKGKGFIPCSNDSAVLYMYLDVTFIPSGSSLQRYRVQSSGGVVDLDSCATRRPRTRFFSMFCEMFRHLPVCSVIHGKVLVIHGGLFHREGVTLEDIEQVNTTAGVVAAVVAVE